MQTTTGTVGGSKTFLALPIYGIDPFFSISMWNLVASNKFNGGIRPEVGDSSPSRIRNTLVHSFLESDCDQLLFIDSDISFTPQDIERICYWKELVVGGFYCAKDARGAKLIYNNFGANQPPARPDGMQKVLFMGTGFLKIRRQVFEIMANRLKDEICHQLDEAPAGTMRYAFFEEKVYKYPNGGTRFLTEDWLFCQRCQDLGIDVWADTGILVNHHGGTAFPLEHHKAQILRPATAQPAPVPAPSTPLPVVPGDGARTASDTVTRDVTDQFVRKPEPVTA